MLAYRYNINKLHTAYKQSIMRIRFSVNSALLLVFLVKSVAGSNNDLFNYGMDTKAQDGGQSYGQSNWASVTCSDLNTCVSKTLNVERVSDVLRIYGIF